MEYDYALERQLPVLAFLHKDPSAIPSGKTEDKDQGKEALDAFRKKIEKSRHANYWKSATELAGSVALGILNLKKFKSAIGWVRGDQVPDESASEEILRLRREVDRLQKQVNDAAQEPPEGSRGLAQGDETVSLHFRVYIKDWQNTIFDLSWNEMLSKVGPILFNPTYEHEFRTALVRVVENRMMDQGKETVHPGETHPLAP